MTLFLSNQQKCSAIHNACAKKVGLNTHELNELRDKSGVKLTIIFNHL